MQSTWLEAKENHETFPENRGRHSSEPTLSPKGYGSVGLLGLTLSMVGLRSDGRTVSGEFSGNFSGEFSRGQWTILPLKSNFRACVVLAWFHPSSSCSFDYISRVVGKIDVSGAMNVRRMSGDWIASVWLAVIYECYLVDPASSHMLVSKIKPCMFARSAFGEHRSACPFCRRYAPGHNWPGRASGAVTLKKLGQSVQQPRNVLDIWSINRPTIKHEHDRSTVQHPGLEMKGQPASQQSNKNMTGRPTQTMVRKRYVTSLGRSSQSHKNYPTT
uniref:Uncharacterized protein n=1 Tax=Brassica oleracea var. oleracea TaxID=109376 RepID=A0A0D3AW24_BRAOL